MAHLREKIILALFVHNASLTPSMKFKELLVENARWDDMKLLTTPMQTGDNQRSVILLNFNKWSYSQRIHAGFLSNRSA